MVAGDHVPTKSFTDFRVDCAAISAAHLKIIHENYRLAMIGRFEGGATGRPRLTTRGHQTSLLDTRLSVCILETASRDGWPNLL